MNPHGRVLASLAGLLAGCGGGASPPPQEIHPVSFVERQEDGGERSFVAEGGRRVEVDLNSLLEIRVDENRLAERIDSGSPASPTVPTGLQDRVDALGAALDATEEAEALEASAFRSWAADPRSARSAIAAYARVTTAILDPFEEAVEARMPGASSGAREAELDRILGSGLAGGPRGGIQWGVVRDALAGELSLLGAVMDTLREVPRPGIQIRAYYLGSRTSEGLPLPLAGYNDEPVGERSVVEKVVLAVSEEERQLYDAYGRLAVQVGAKSSAGAALREVLEAEFDQRRAALQELAEAAEGLVRSAAGDLEALRGLLDGRVNDLLNEMVEALKASEAGRRTESLVMGFLDPGAGIIDFSLLQGFSDLSQTLPGQSPAGALSTLLHLLDRVGRIPSASTLRGDVWEAHLDSLRALAASVRDLEGPVRNELTRLIGTELGGLPSPVLEEAVQRFLRAAAPVRGWLDDLAGRRGTLLLSDLPEPRGQRTIPLASQADTELDLQRLPPTRTAAEDVLVRFTLLSGDEVVDGGWTDRLRLKAFGWSARTVASLAFIRRSGRSTYVPTPVLSWVARYRPWPGSGGKEIPLSFGLSTATLDFSEEKEVELGLAATVGILDDWALLGYGWNLQETTERGFFFFSIRFLTGPGGLAGS